MKSTLVFFDTSENGNIGNLRGLVIFPVFIILTAAWMFITKKSLYDKHIDQVGIGSRIISIGIMAVLIVSAVAVHTPDTATKAVVYAGLVGLVVYGIHNSVLLMTSNKWGYGISIIDTVWGVLSTALLGYILYNIVQEWPDTFSFT